MSAYDVFYLQTLSGPSGLALTARALAPGMGESTLDGQHTKAISYWQSILAIGGGIASAPAAPVPTNIATTGTVLAGVYGVIVTYTTAGGETAGSVAGATTTSGSLSVITVPSPNAITGATGWYAYVTQANGSVYTRQQAAGSPTAIGTPLTISAPPTSTGVNPPTVNQSGIAAALIADAIAHLTARLSYLQFPGVGIVVPDRNS